MNNLPLPLDIINIIRDYDKPTEKFNLVLYQMITNRYGMVCWVCGIDEFHIVNNSFDKQSVFFNRCMSKDCVSYSGGLVFPL